MNITDYYSGSIIGEIISIFKEIEMNINVVKIDVKQTKFGIKKELLAYDGKKYRVGSRQKFYDDVQNPGVYAIEMGDYEGKPFVKSLKYVGNLPSDNKFVPKTNAATASVSADALKAKAEQDRKRQDDIRLEFYCNIAKDILIANKKANEDISFDDVMWNAKKMYVKHLDILSMLDAEAKGIEVVADKPEVKEEPQAKQEPVDEEDIPF